MKPTERLLDTLTKADTVALWHAVEWMDLCLREPAKEPHEAAALDIERERLQAAKRALRKVSAIRKQQAEISKFRNFENCRPTEKLQEQRKAAGGPP